MAESFGLDVLLVAFAAGLLSVIVLPLVGLAMRQPVGASVDSTSAGGASPSSLEA